jgi:hypothetical protein
MAAGPSHVTIWPSLKEADDRSKGIEGRREDWIRQRCDMFGLRCRFPRQFMTGSHVYATTAAQLAEARERAATEPKQPTEVVVGKPLDAKPSKGNGSEATVEPEPAVKQIPVTPVGK